MAASFAECAEDEIPEEWLDQIIVLRIPVSSLNPDQIEVDPHVQADIPSQICWIYQGVVPWNNFKIFEL